ncbi:MULTISPECIES: sigma-E processing peptidase SpoIIGA [unclassified Paenibacillus]|uniref:sigma-E processing peptidase SpoIIGA n=1 Tax=unclassified Paenibacillus TaxID=185978 RepID=UPI001AE4B983|nr:MULTISPECIES: sigma-E processing peptidase SpoIIGA [unclassified Paenibacillus]MBP1156271.1 stage II sporulation protein GA (sporulation sigma-E factor processing peptidase) [Paenibacillus sp. PvP091]MBP1168343.1 stage II sporulation protein GA (sporulation sigma-E factor processing peptidase) [Paenibacillus sp. PvR098]MBP2439371.1 stage II sporulation protein GA (sporulation sigma-E factor processing peptidase) [Paenibacillus sp. PvP052]
MIVYIDVIFLFNVLIDGVLLWTTAWSRKLHFRWWRLGLSAAIGGSYAIMLFFPPLSFLYTFAVKFMLSLLMLLTAFGFGGLQHFVRNLGAFYLINFAAAGGVVGFVYFWQSSGEFVQGILISRDLKVTLPLLLFSIPFTLWIYRQVTQALRRKQVLTTYIVKVDVHIDDFASTCTGLIDTGNQLYDPLTKTPVMVMEAAQWGEHIPEAWMVKIRRAEVDQLVSSIGTEPFIWQDRLRLVPYRGVNRSTQFMLAIKPDRVVITTEGKQIETMKVLIGLDGGRLSSDNAYQAIIHPALMESVQS